MREHFCAETQPTNHHVAQARDSQFHSSQPATTRKTYDALVLDARLRQSLVTVRSLGSRGLRVAALEMFERAPAFSSRWCRKAFVCPTDGSAETYLTYLEQLLDRVGVRVLIASTDDSAALFSQHRSRLERRVHIALAREPALGRALNKEQTLEIAGQLGLAIPRSILVQGENEVEAALHDVGLPVVIKPVQSWAWRGQQHVHLGCKLVTTLDEARSAMEELTSQGVAALFQQYLSGRREAISFLYAGGQFYARFAQWARRTVPQLGGTSVLRQSIAIPSDTGEQAERLVREIELEGYSEVEFRRDGEGTPYLMEINPRLSASVEIAVRAGVDFPYLLYQWANGDQIETVRGYHTGQWIRHLGGDIMTTLEAVQKDGKPGIPPRNKALFDFFASFLIPMRYDYLDLRDPLPASVATVAFMDYWRQRIGKRLARSFQPVQS